jgi:predicted ATP-dependent protease
MLRHDVVEAVAAGKFSVYPVKTIDEGMEILTGIAAGERDGTGKFPEGSINHRVERRLVEFAERARLPGPGEARAKPWRGKKDK